MPRESRHMSEQSHVQFIRALAALVIGTVCLLATHPALAQQFYLRPPNLAPSRPSIYCGTFYVNAGIKYRNVQETSFKTKEQQLTNIVWNGQPAFGPFRNDKIAYPQVPAGSAATNPNASGIWLYDDGFIEPTGTIGASGAVVGPPPGANRAYPGGGVGLGRVNDNEALAPIDNGTFRLVDHYLQVNDGGLLPFGPGLGPYNGSRGVTWSKLLTGLTATSLNYILLQAAPGTPLTLGPAVGTPYVGAGWGEIPSAGYGVDVNPCTETRVTNKIVTPFFEVGYQFGNYVDLFTSFSWFNLSDAFGRIGPATVATARTGYRDTFPWGSTDTTVWATSPFFWSGNQNTTPPLFSYVIWPTGYSVDGSEITPNRVFFTAVDTQGPGYPANEIISSTLECQVYELRPSLRSWYPLYGFGRIGTSLGGLVAPMTYSVTTNAQYVATAAIPATINTPAVAVGTPLINVVDTHKDLWWNWGVSGGLDLEIGVSSIYFKAGAEYNCYFTPLNYGDITEVKVNIGGFGATAVLGARF